MLQSFIKPNCEEDTIQEEEESEFLFGWCRQFPEDIGWDERWEEGDASIAMNLNDPIAERIL